MLITSALCSGTCSGGGLEEVDVFMPEDGKEGLKHNSDSQEQTRVTSDSLQITLKRMKVESPESGVQPTQDDHEGVVLKTYQGDPTYGFKKMECIILGSVRK